MDKQHSGNENIRNKIRKFLKIYFEIGLFLPPTYFIFLCLSVFTKSVNRLLLYTLYKICEKYLHFRKTYFYSLFKVFDAAKQNYTTFHLLVTRLSENIVYYSAYFFEFVYGFAHIHFLRISYFYR